MLREKTERVHRNFSMFYINCSFKGKYFHGGKHSMGESVPTNPFLGEKNYFKIS